MNKTQLKSGLHALVWKEDKLFVAKCVEIEVVSQGQTRQKAISNLQEALELYFEDEKLSVPSLSNLGLFPLKIGYA